MKSSACCLVSVGWAHPISEAGSRAAWEEKKHASVTFTMPLTVGSHAPVDAGLRLSRGLGLWVVSEVKVGGRPWSKDHGGPRPDPQTRPRTTPVLYGGYLFFAHWGPVTTGTVVSVPQCPRPDQGWQGRALPLPLVSKSGATDTSGFAEMSVLFVKVRVSH